MGGKFKTILKVFLIFLGACLVVDLIYFLIGSGGSPEIFKQYSDLAEMPVSSYNKSVQFLSAWTRATGDTSLAVAMGFSEEEAMQMVNGTYGTETEQTGGASIDIPQDVQDLCQMILSAQTTGGTPGSDASCNAVFNIIYDNPGLSYTDLRSFNNKTKRLIEDLNKNNLTTITVDVWKFQNPNMNSTDLTKTSGTLNITVCKNLAPIYKQVFAEIYADPSQPIVFEAGGLCVRGMNNSSSNSSSKTSTHSYGGTIDLNYSKVAWNWNQNNGDATHPYPRSYQDWSSLSETQYKYCCLYEGCPIVTIMEKYGMHWGGSWSKQYADPMHFSIFDH